MRACRNELLVATISSDDACLDLRAANTRHELMISFYVIAYDAMSAAIASSVIVKYLARRQDTLCHVDELIVRQMPATAIWHHVSDRDYSLVERLGGRSYGHCPCHAAENERAAEEATMLTLQHFEMRPVTPSRASRLVPVCHQLWASSCYKNRPGRRAMPKVPGRKSDVVQARRPWRQDERSGPDASLPPAFL